MSALVDLAIGLTYVYLLFSLAVTAGTEFVSALFASRGRMLKQGITRLVGDAKLVEGFYEHALLRSLKKRASSLPSYVPARTFALVLIDLVFGGESRKALGFDEIKAAAQTRKDNVGQVLKVFVADAELSAGQPGPQPGTGWSATDARLEGLRSALETWFDDTMERTSGWYKRQTQLVSFTMAALLTVLFNADTLVIAQRLWTDSGLRTALVSQAEAYAKANTPAAGDAFVPEAGADPQSSLAVPPPPCPPYEVCGLDETADNFEHSLGRLNALALPLGWGPEAGEGGASVKDRVVRHLPGWMLTVLAISLGAPFWFDVLNRFIAIRSAGKAPEEKQKSPKEVPRPDAGGTHAKDTASPAPAS
jgi:hypothetical protein